MNRRDLMKYFGIGATITPVVNGAPIVEVAAKLLAEPNLSIVTASDFPRWHDPKLFADRLKWNPYEAIWLKFWQIENDPPHCINYGIGPLDHILGRESNADERAAVAGMMQWFGTNCGHSFIEETLNACGYRVTFDYKSSEAEHLRRIRNDSVFEKTPKHSVTITRRGRPFTLTTGEMPR